MKIYDLTYIISTEASSEEAQSISKKIESFIQDKNGSIIKHQNPVAKTLAFPIKKHASGFMGFIEFQTEEENIKELNEELAKNEKFSRYMITIKETSKLRKKRGTKKNTPSFTTHTKAEEKTEELKPTPAKPTEDAQKVELKDIEQKLEELLGE